MSKVAVRRAGAIGDIFMLANCFPKLREQYDEIDLITHDGMNEILGGFLRNNGLIDRVCNFSHFVESDYDKVVECVGYPFHEGYPHVKMRKHILEFFADELGVEASFDDLVCRIPKTDIIFKAFKMPYVTIQNKTGWSIYKEWDGWHELINKMRREIPEVGIYHIGGEDDPLLANVDGTFCGRSFEDNLAVQAHSKTHLGLDSVFNHVTNVKWNGAPKKSCIILWGSTQYDGSGYSHNTNISLQLPCQPCFRENPGISVVPGGICPNPPDQTYENPRHDCMAGITVDMVYDALADILEVNE